MIQIKPETPKLLQDNVRGALHDTGIGKDMLNRTPCAQELRPINHWPQVRPHKTETFCTEIETINQVKRKTKELDRIFVSNISDRGLISRIQKQ